MRDMAEVRVALTQGSPPPPAADPILEPVGVGTIDDETDNDSRATSPENRDERHLNQYLA